MPAMTQNFNISDSSSEFEHSATNPPDESSVQTVMDTPAEESIRSAFGRLFSVLECKIVDEEKLEAMLAKRRANALADFEKAKRQLEQLEQDENLIIMAHECGLSHNTDVDVSAVEHRNTRLNAKIYTRAQDEPFVLCQSSSNLEENEASKRISIISTRLKVVKEEEAKLKNELKDLFREQEAMALEELTMAQKRCETVKEEHKRMGEELGDLFQDENMHSHDVEGADDELQSHVGSDESAEEEEPQMPSKYSGMISIATEKKDRKLRQMERTRKLVESHEAKGHEWAGLAIELKQLGDEKAAEAAQGEEREALRLAQYYRSEQKEQADAISRLTELLSSLERQEKLHDLSM